MPQASSPPSPVYDPLALLSRDQRHNLAVLADYLERLPADYAYFDMYNYLSADEADLCDQQHYALHNGGLGQLGCGTAACAVGHGPAAGVLFSLDELEDEDGDLDWERYALRFCPAATDPEQAVFTFLFGSNWKYSDNTVHGAAARIRYVLADQPLPAYISLETRSFCIPAAPGALMRAVYAGYRVAPHPADAALQSTPQPQPTE